MLHGAEFRSYYSTHRLYASKESGSARRSTRCGLIRSGIYMSFWRVGIFFICAMTVLLSPHAQALCRRWTFFQPRRMHSQDTRFV